MSQVLPVTPVKVPVMTRLAIRAVVRVARVVSKQKPARLRRFLTAASRGSRPGTYTDVSRARNEILTVSTTCRGSSACLIRSTAVVLLCRLRGSWADWCVGVMAEPPFQAHAWVEAEGRIVDEVAGRGELRKLFRVERPNLTTSSR
ncbi:lasso peptide biosynthesis B2 protein [Micromonospora sp. NPDC047074]|uniref:lasso peptide biosynthesis B2 protein n=1 Tax=Micromonospora sp. NPDC047074 TaxID=3154339 RepID=UPI0033FDFE6C